MRTRVEATLAGPENTDAYRAALEATIDESDQLIRTFNALLMIARIEAGSPDGAMGPIDLSPILADVAEFYEPVAEEAEVFLALSLDDPLPITGNRELISQAIGNLVDNAIKYVRSGAQAPTSPRVTIARAPRGRLDRRFRRRQWSRHCARGPGARSPAFRAS